MCVFCNGEPETVLHLFHNCPVVKLFWIEMERFIKDHMGVSICPNIKDIILYFERNFECKVIFMLNLILFGKF